ncbi:MAG: hypothetical protein ABSE45_05325 [Candidatus Acidiferrales bacterium]|jgi:hypothetical protein
MNTVKVMIRSKLDGNYPYLPAVVNSNGRIKPGVALIGGVETKVEGSSCSKAISIAHPHSKVDYMSVSKPYFRDELCSTNLWALFFISIYAGSNAVKTPRR